jgi:hypothetical protein
VENEDFDIITLVSNTLEPLSIPVIEGWYDEELNKTHITVHEYLDQEYDFEDDEASCINHNIQVDIWSKDSLEAYKLKKEVRKLLKKSDFLVQQGQDFYETDTKIYHKAMKFTYTEYM